MQNAAEGSGVRDSREDRAMPYWTVKATWLEDEVEASQKWDVNAPTALDAVKEAMAHVRFQPHHVEVKLCRGESISELRPGEARSVPES
jgi:hypothetical protein